MIPAFKNWIDLHDQNSLKKLILFFLPLTYSVPQLCVCLHMLNLCLTLCNYMDYSPPRFSVHGIFQARILEWVAISYSRRSSQLRDQTCVSCIAGGFFANCATWYRQNRRNGVWQKLVNEDRRRTTSSPDLLVWLGCWVEGLKDEQCSWRQRRYQP